MATAQQARHEKAQPKVNQLMPVKFKDVSGAPVTLTFKDVKEFLCGNQNNKPTDTEVYLFMHFCRAHEADPFAKDAQLIKYSERGPAAFVLTFYHVNKVASSDPDYDGCESGIVIKHKDGELEYREGTLLFEEDGEVLVGGWAKAYSKRQDHEPLVTVKLSTYDKSGKGDSDQGANRWNIDKPGMIRKVAVVQAKREVCPRKLSNAYIQEEISPDGLGQRVIDITSPEQLQNLEASMFESLRDALIENKKDFHEADLREYMEQVAETIQLSLTEACQRFVENVTNDVELEKFWNHFQRWVNKRTQGEKAEEGSQEGAESDAEETSGETQGDDTQGKKDEASEVEADVQELRKQIGSQLFPVYRCYLHLQKFNTDKELKLAQDLLADEEALKQFAHELNKWWNNLKKKDQEAALREVNEGRLFL